MIPKENTLYPLQGEAALGSTVFVGLATSF